MRVYVVLSSAPMGSELIAVCSTAERALKEVIKDLEKGIALEEIERDMEKMGIDKFLSIYEYSIFECEVDGKGRRYVLFEECEN